MKLFDFDLLVDRTKALVKTRPVEILVCIVAYALMEIEFYDNALLMPIVFGVVFALGNVACEGKYRWIYYASALLIGVAAVAEAEAFVDSSAYAYSLLLTAMVMLLSKHGSDDRQVGENFVDLALSAIMSVILFAVVSLAIFLILASVFFIFSIESDLWNFYKHIFYFMTYVAMPVTFLECQYTGVGCKVIKMRFFDILLNYVVGSALIVYTAVLYAYLLKIGVTWELPKGGITAMISAFYIVAFLGLMINKVLPNRFYNWFYRFFGYISLPLLVLFWVSLTYRIGEYSFTENRIYMLLAGVTMVMGSVVLIAVPRWRFATILSIAAVLIATFTFIPGITARTIGINCQRSRMIDIAKTLGYYDDSEQTIVWPEKLSAEKSNQYNEMLSSYYYLIRATDRETVIKEYGENILSAQDQYEYRYQSYYREGEVNLGEYTRIAANQGVRIEIKDGNVIATYNGKEVLREPLRYSVVKSSGARILKEGDYVYSNDSCKLVINEFEVYNKTDVRVYNYDGLFFK